MDLDQLIQEHIVFGISHKHSKRIAEVKKFAWQIMTGEDQDEWVNKFRPSETKEQKAQRNNIYTNLTKYVVARPRKYWKKLARTDGVKITIEGKDDNKLEQLNNNFSNFYGGRSLEEYLHWKLEYCQFFNPNSFSIYERSDQRDESGEITKTIVYPIIVPSENVINEVYANGDLIILLVQYPRNEMILEKGNKPKQISLTDYVSYKAGQTVEYREVANEQKADETVNEGGEKLVLRDYNNKNRHFVRFDYDTGTTEIPAISNGAYRDEETNQETNVTPFEPATDVFIDLIKNKSLLDVSVMLHVFLKKFVYVKHCTFSNQEGICKGGLINGSYDNICPSCHGSGKAPIHTTDQEVVELAMPEKAEELLELAKLSHYELLPMDIVTFLHELVNESEQRVLKAIFNLDIFERAQINKTATEIINERDELYDVLQPFFNLVSAHFEKAHRLCAQYLEIPEFKVSHQAPKDYKMETLEQLIAEVGAMTQAGVGYDSINQVRRDILKKQYANNPNKILKIEAAEKWRPFADKSQEVAAMIISGKAPTDFYRVLFEHFTDIFVQIDETYPEFYKLTYDKQKQILEKIVAQFAANLKPANQPLDFQNVE